MLFENGKHEKLFYQYLEGMKEHDGNHAALAYLMALIDDDEGQNGMRLYHRSTDTIRPDALSEGWQTSSTVKATRLAFNLFTDGVQWSDPEDVALICPSEVFSNGQWRQYFFEAVRIRFEGIE